MKNIILLDTSIGTTNKGDDIIMKCCEEDLADIIKGNYVVKFPTHTTPFSWLQTKIWWKADWVKKADAKFICGTNLLANNMRYLLNDFNINIFNTSPLCDSILVGVGNSRLDKKLNGYTKRLYKKLLSKDFIHSTRDDETTKMIQDIGFKAITTGCVTLWKFTPEFCKEIPTQKSEEVVFTITGSQRNPEKDQLMLDIIKRKYRKRYLYLQTIWDMDYFKALKDIDDVEFVGPNIEEYSEFLNSHDVDYVGTRLHGGIYAMHHKKRAIILSIDNRARNINKVNHLNCIERDDIGEKLEKFINSEFETKVNMNFDNINKWKSQFDFLKESTINNEKLQ